MLITYLYLKLGLSGLAISRELGINKNTVQRFIRKLREWAKFFRSMLKLDEPVEVDETYKNAGRKGGKKRKDSHKRGRKGRGRGTYAKDRPPTFTIYGKDTGFVIYKTTNNVARRVIRADVIMRFILMSTVSIIGLVGLISIRV